MSYITLIRKENSDRTQLKNYRPISLLNVDYKILTKSLTNKLKPFMASLIHTDQQCSVQGRNIHNHTHFIRDFITYAHHKDYQTSILSLDQEKAFDRISHAYLHKTLAHCNIGEYFRKWIQIIYSHPESKILVNHILTQSFALTRSVRQGCSLSALLYALSIEPVLEKIRGDKHIKGSLIPGMGERKLLAYADDTLFFPPNNSSIENILNTFQVFGSGSGAKINVQKSLIMGLGKWKNKTDYPFRLTTTQHMKIYGITYHSNPNHTHKDTWQAITTTINDMLERYKYKTSTIFGRSVVVNTYIIPKLLYTATVLEPPQKTLTDINKQIRRFIFGNTIHGIQHKTLIQDKKQGGVSLQDIRTKIQTLRICYIGHIIKQPNHHTIAHYYMGLRLSKLKPLDNTIPHHFGSLPPFHKSCIQAIKGHEKLLHQKSNTIYKHLIRIQAPPIQLRIKRGHKYFKTNYIDTFTNLHNPLIRNKPREILYRLIFGISPTRHKQALKRNTILQCQLCRMGIQETEEHIFFNCRTLTQIKDTLQDRLDTTAKQHVDIYRALFLLTIPKYTLPTNTKLLPLIAEYLDVVWTCRNKAVFNHRIFTPSTLATIYSLRIGSFLSE
jgi:hypothetical protein